MNTYEIITAIVAGYGALLATYTLIVQVREKVRRIKVTFNPGFIETAGQLGESMFILNGANIGHVDTTLSGHAITPHDGSQIIFRRPGAEHQFPYVLEPGKSCTLWLPAKEIASSLKSHGFSGVINIRGVLKDQTGKRFKSKAVQFNIESWLER